MCGFPRLLALLLSLAMLLLVSCCGSSAVPGEIASGSTQALDAIDSLSPPAGTDPAVWELLKSRLASELAHYPPRSTSAPPSRVESQVRDLRTAEGSEWNYVAFNWTYRNYGDYDQNGEVNAGDITPIAMHFGKTSEAEDWAQAQLADGDGNGEINSADITPIAVNYLSVVTGYALQTTTTPGDTGSWAAAGTVGITDATLPEGGGVLQFSLELEAAPGQFYRVVPQDASAPGVDGIASPEMVLVDSDGGEFSFPGVGATLIVPSYALDFFDDFAGLSLATPTSYPDAENMVPGTLVELLPHDYEFEEAVELRVPYDPASLPAGANEAGIKLHEAGQERWTPIAASYTESASDVIRTQLLTGGVFCGICLLFDPWNMYEGDYIIEDQATYDDFIRYEAISGTLTINYTDLTNFDGLSGLEWVGGSFIFHNNQHVVALDSFTALTDVYGDFEISGNSGAMTSLDFPALTQIGGRLEVSNNELLEDMDFQALQYTGTGVDIQNDDALTSLVGLSNLSHPAPGWAPGDVYEVLVGSMDAMTSLTGLEGISGTVSNVEITNCYALQGLGGIDGISRVVYHNYEGGEYRIENCDQLTNLNGSSITSADDVVLIWYNDGLTSLAGLGNLSATTGSVDIEHNSILEHLGGLDSLFSVDFLSIRHNDSLIDLQGLGSLTLVRRAVDIYNNDKLESLDGLDALTTITENHLWIRHNNVLDNIDALSHLQSIGGGLEILENYALRHLDGFSGLHHIGAYTMANGNHFGSLKIINNWDLTDIGALDGLTAIGAYVIHGDFTVQLTPCTASANAVLAAWGGPGSVSGTVLIE